MTKNNLSLVLQSKKTIHYNHHTTLPQKSYFENNLQLLLSFNLITDSPDNAILKVVNIKAQKI